ncbi:Wzz/FepE/Etk N-terminal domain-containing protein [Comamonadaceae bacterium M7527]|nr:Wzz/FepE/Etk N-terminal domain-containing protein [Comamonadaceae bacterium M7527]
MNETPRSAMDDEIDLLDLLVTVAESWKLLVIAPVLIAIAAFTGATFIKPNLYQSTAILRLAENEAALLHSAAILDPLAESFGYLSEAEGVREDAREALKNDLASSVDKRTKLVTITAKSTSAEQAQKLNQQAIERLLAELTPKGQDKANILRQIEIRKQAISAAENAFEQIVQASPEGTAGTSNAESSNIVLLVTENKQAIQALEERLLVKGAEVFVQTPTLAQKPLPRKRALIAVIAALASGFALLLFVFIRKALMNAGANPESAKKIAQIKQSLGMSSKAT